MRWGGGFGAAPTTAGRRLPEQARLCGCALLERVRQLVGDQALACLGSRSIRARGERYMGPCSVRERSDGARRDGRMVVRMNADMGKVVSEARFEEGASGCVERLPV